MGFGRGLMEPESASHQGRGALVHKKTASRRGRGADSQNLCSLYMYIYIEIYTDIYMLHCMLLLTYVYRCICVYTIERKQSEVVVVSQSESSEGCNL